MSERNTRGGDPAHDEHHHQGKDNEHDRDGPDPAVPRESVRERRTVKLVAAGLRLEDDALREQALQPPSFDPAEIRERLRGVRRERSRAQETIDQSPFSDGPGWNRHGYSFINLYKVTAARLVCDGRLVRSAVSPGV